MPAAGPPDGTMREQHRMQQDPPESTGDEFAVRLSWPKVVVLPKDEPEPAPPPPPPTPPAPAAAPSPAPRAPAAAVRPAATPARPPQPPSPPAAPVTTLRTGAGAQRPAAPSDPGAIPETGVARSFVDAFDRLSDRLLDRLRVLRQDVDADLNGLRSEVAALRQALEDNTHGLQLRQLQMSVDEVRTEVAGLRRAVLEWPELERVADEVAGVRGDLSLLFDGVGVGTAPSALLAELGEVVGRLAEETNRLDTEGIAVGASGEGHVSFLVDEVSSIRTEVADLARRLPVSLGDDPKLLDRIADAVTERLLEQLDGGRRPKRR